MSFLEGTVPLLMAPRTLSDGEGLVVHAYGGIRMSVVVGAGATVSYSRVDSASASSHDAATQVDIVADTDVDVAWPWYYVSTAAGSCRVVVV